MTLEDLGNLGEFVAAIGVIASLVYLALQIRQNTASLRSSTHQQLAQLSVVQVGGANVNGKLEALLLESRALVLGGAPAAPVPDH